MNRPYKKRINRLTIKQTGLENVSRETFSMAAEIAVITCADFL